MVAPLNFGNVPSIFPVDQLAELLNRQIQALPSLPNPIPERPQLWPRLLVTPGQRDVSFALDTSNYFGRYSPN